METKKNSNETHFEIWPFWGSNRYCQFESGKDLYANFKWCAELLIRVDFLRKWRKQKKNKRMARSIDLFYFPNRNLIHILILIVWKKCTSHSSTSDGSHSCFNQLTLFIDAFVDDLLCYWFMVIPIILRNFQENGNRAPLKKSKPSKSSDFSNYLFMNINFWLQMSLFRS